MRIQVSVTDEDINLAHRREDSRCPIAMSIIRAYPSARHVKVTRDEISFSDLTTRLRHRYRTPRPAQVFVDNWDEGREARPLVFRLESGNKIETKVMKARGPAQVAARDRVKERTIKAAPSRPRYQRVPVGDAS